MKNDLRELLKMLRQMKLSETTRKRCRSAIAVLVVFITTYTLIMPAVTLERNKVSDIKGLNLSEQNVKALNCHFPVHQHTEECYKMVPEYDSGGRKTGTKKVLNCWKADWVVHKHDANCYENGLLVCPLPEYMEHIHDAFCYTMQRVLTCDKEETPGHRHTDACYQTTQYIACGKEEHRHSEQCYSDVVTGTEQKLVCGYDEGEELSPAVYSDPVVDEETGETIEEAHLVQDAVVHHHTDSCYETETKTERQLTCGLTEHVHSDACYQTESKLICGQPEEEGHTHTDACYKEEKVLTCTELAPHQHTIDCYEKGPKGESPLEMGWVTLTYDEYGNEILNGDPNHLICGKIELLKHQHDDGCFVDMPVGEGESAENGTAGEADALENGIAGEAGALENGAAGEADYQADGFVSDMSLQEEGTGEEGFYENEITFDENGNPIENPDGDDTDTEGRDNETPSGLIVLNPDGEEDQADDSENGEYAENVDAEDTDVEDADADEKDDQGDADEESADAEDTEKASEEGTPFTKTIEVEGASYSLIVSGEEACGIPENAVFKATAISENRDDYDAYREKALAAVDNYTTEETSRAEEMPGLFDLTIYDEDGNEIQPAAPLSIRVDLGDAIGEEASGIYAVHFPGTNADTIMQPTPDNPVGKAARVISEKITGTGTEVIETRTEDDGAVQFEAESLSVYAIVYTVDFHWEVDGKKYEFSIPGGGFVSFTDLVEMLGIMGDTNTAIVPDDAEVSDAAKEFVKDVASVEFSSPELMWVGKIAADSTVGELKETNGLECEYSAELTETQITEINAQVVEAGDWAMISRKPFTSVETLTVTMKDGEAFTIRVTDAQISTNVLTADGKTYKITVTYEDDAGIPDGTKLFAKEIEPGTDEYLQHLGQAWTEVNKEYLKIEEQRKIYNESMGFLPEVKAQNLDASRFFDVKMMNRGEVVEPSAPVHVEISYVEGLHAEEEADVNIAHFSDEGLELIDDVEIEKEDSEIVSFRYDQDSFSDIGTLVSHETQDRNLSSNAVRIMKSEEQPTRRESSGDDESELDKPYANKTLVPNKTADGTKDGTYTLTLSVGGTSKESSYSDVSKSNVLIVMDRSSSMVNNYTYDKYDGAYNNKFSYFGIVNNQYVQLNYSNGSYTYNNYTFPFTHTYNGQVYTRRSRLEAEQDALDSLISELTAKNKPGQTVTDENGNTVSLADIIEVKIISFASGRTDKDKANGFQRNGNNVNVKDNSTFSDTESDWGSSYEDGSTLKKAVDDNSVAQGTNWQEAMQYAKEVADQKKAQQPDEPVYVIFLTDGEPTDIEGDNGNAQWYQDNEKCLKAAEPDAKAIIDGHNVQTTTGETVTTDHKFYGIFTYGENDIMKSYLRRLVNYAYDKGDVSAANVAGGTADYYYDADSTSALLNAFQNIFSKITETMAYGKVSITDGLTTDAMTTTLVHGKAEGYKYMVEGPVGELYSVTAVDPEAGQAEPQVIFTINGHDYPGEKKTTEIDGSTYTYWSYTSGTGENAIEYKMTLADVSDNGMLTWNLAGIGTLMDGYTYNVSFVVWPDQDAYDYVAALNNGLEGYTWNTSADTYQDLTETKGYAAGGVERFPSIVKYENGTFAVLTNTEQKLQYSIVETKEEDGTTTTTYDGPYEFDLPTPKPMDLIATASMISKVWNIDRDPRVLAQLLYNPDGTSKKYSIGFEILQKQDSADKHYTDVILGWDEKKEKYVWDEMSKRTVDYNGHDCEIATKWDADFSIATGLMVSEIRRKALGLSKEDYPTAVYNGVTYYILEEGHDYTIKEPVLSYEFDFSAPVYHPMLVDGVLQNVTFSKNGDSYNVSKMESIDVKEGVSSLVIENTLRGYIHLNKMVVDKAGAQLKEDDTKFTYNITLNNEYPVFKGDSITWYGINELFYHDADFNYYQAEPAAEAGKLLLKDEKGNTYTATCAGTFNPDIIGPTEVKYTDNSGVEKTIQLYGNQMTPSDGNETDGYKTTSATLKINQNEILNIANVPVNTDYVITEVQEAGYELAGVTRKVGSGTVENLSELTVEGSIVANTDNNITYKNKSNSVNITVQKLDGDGEGLEGAVFQLKTVSENEMEEALAIETEGIGGIGKVTMKEGGETKTYESAFETTGNVQTITRLPDGKYRLYEVYVPAGYISTYKYIQFEIEDRVMKNVTTDTGDTALLHFEAATATETEAKLALLQINNTPGAALPNTGGSGTRLFTIFGSILILGAGILLLKRRRLIIHS